MTLTDIAIIQYPNIFPFNTTGPPTEPVKLQLTTNIKNNLTVQHYNKAAA
jgi:hypothetical protein